MELINIETGNFMLDGGACFGVVPKSIWSKKYPANEDNLVNMAMRCLLIIEGDRKILIDCGLGNKMDPRLLQYYHLNGDDSLLSSLNGAGVTPAEITDVVFTHLHFDHCGGAVVLDEKERLKLQFPNALHYVARKHWNLALNPNRRERSSFFKENYMPIEEAGKLKLVDNNFKLTDNITFKIYDGHTEGQIIPFINIKGRTFVYMADFIPTAVHVPLAYVCGFDINAGLALEEKERFLEKADSEEFVLYFEHDLYCECCTVQRTQKGFAVKDKFSLEEFISKQ